MAELGGHELTLARERVLAGEAHRAAQRVVQTVK
jgi:hypothetical protein